MDHTALDLRLRINSVDRLFKARKPVNTEEQYILYTAISKYILHKLQLAGASSTIIDPAALAAAHSFTQGNPRLIDNLMTDALTIGSQQEKKVIDAEIIRAAVDNQGLY